MNSKWCPNFRNCIGPQEACNVGSGRWPTPRVHENLVRLELSSCWRTWVAVADIGRLYCTSSCIGVCMYVYAFPDFPRTKANRLVGFQSKHTHTTRSHGQPKGFCNGYSFGPVRFPQNERPPRRNSGRNCYLIYTSFHQPESIMESFYHNRTSP